MHFAAKEDILASNWRRTDGTQDPEVQKFAEIYDQDRVEIIRIFSHLLKKYPPENAAELFNYMFVSLFDLKVYQRWSVAKVVAAEVKRRTKSKAKADAVLKHLTEAGNDEAERVATEMGINLKAKRGQWLYKWIEKFMGDRYRKLGKEWHRFTRHDEDMHATPAWSSSRRNQGYSAWDCDTDGGASSGAWGHAVNHRRRRFPTFDEVASCMSQHSCGVSGCDLDDQIAARELMDSVLSGLDDVDRLIIAMKMEGYSFREISEHFHADPDLPSYTHSAIQLRMSKIRKQKRPKPTTKKHR